MDSVKSTSLAPPPRLGTYLNIVLSATAILLGSIKVPYKEIKRRILAIDDENLSEAMLEQLLKYMPTPEQMNQIASMKDQYNDLAEPEQFAVEVGSSSLSCT